MSPDWWQHAPGKNNGAWWLNPDALFRAASNPCDAFLAPDPTYDIERSEVLAQPAVRLRNDWSQPALHLPEKVNQNSTMSPTKETESAKTAGQQPVTSPGQQNGITTSAHSAESSGSKSNGDLAQVSPLRLLWVIPAYWISSWREATLMALPMV